MLPLLHNVAGTAECSRKMAWKTTGHKQFLPCLAMRAQLEALPSSMGRQAGHVHWGSVSAYIRVTRRSVRLSAGGPPQRVDTVDVATLEVKEEERGKGCASGFMTEVLKWARDMKRVVFCESVDEGLHAVLTKRGAVCQDDECSFVIS